MNVWNSLLVIRMLNASTQLVPSLVSATMDISSRKMDSPAQVTLVHCCIS